MRLTIHYILLALMLAGCSRPLWHWESANPKPKFKKIRLLELPKEDRFTCSDCHRKGRFSR